jgi:transcriptional regulator
MMYSPSHFVENDATEILQLIQRYPFGLLVTALGDEPLTSHLPFLAEICDGHMKLSAHMARANPHWRRLADTTAMVVFSGPHGFVSPSWYADPAHSVPTWNYVAVHCLGTPRLLDEDHTRTLLRHLTDEMERGSSNPWSIESADQRFMRQQEHAIVGFEIAVQRCQAKFKLSQNRPADDQREVVRNLQYSSAPSARELAALMSSYYARRNGAETH